MPYYTLVDFPREGETYGEYEGRTPKLAANKILTILARKIKLNNSNNSDNKFIVFIIRNINTRKEYKYIGTRVKLNKPKIVYYNGKEVKHYYKNIVTQYDDYLMRNN